MTPAHDAGGASAGPAGGASGEPQVPPVAHASERASGSGFGARALLLFLLVSIAWTWPAARLDPDVLVTRQFDLYPTVWLLGRARDVPLDLVHAGSAWPVGELLARADSFVLLALGWINPFDPRVAVALLTVLGPALSAWAAERCAARAFGVPEPASWVAGLAYGFSGVAATAVLEGHVYHAFDPWLPLLVWAAVRATAPDGRAHHGLLAGLAWALALFTTAYAGVVGALVLAGLGLRAGRRSLALLPAALVAVPAGLWYVSIYRVGGGFSDGHPTTPEQAWNAGTTTLATLAGWSDAVDLRAHSVGAPLGLLTVGLCVLAPVVLRGRPGWRTLLALGALGVFLSLGRYIRVESGGTAFWTPVSLLMRLPGVEVFRFPARFAWLWALGGGLVAARVFAELATSRWLVRTGVALAIGQVFLGTGLPWRLRAQAGGVPSAYTSGEGAVLDLWPRAADRSSGELELWARALGCYYQAFHRRPTLEVCLGTSVDSPRERVDRWLTKGLLRGDTGLVEGLQALGIGAVVLHAGLYRAGDREALAAALTERLGEATRSTDGGESVWAWSVPIVAGDPRAAWREW